MYKPYGIFSDDNAEDAYVQALVGSIIRACGCDLAYILSAPFNNAFMRDHFALTILDAVAIKSEKTKDIDSIFERITPNLPGFKALAIKSSFTGGNILQVVKGELNTLYYGDYGKEQGGQKGFNPCLFKDLPSTDFPEKFISELNSRKAKSKSSALVRTVFKTLAVNHGVGKDRSIWDVNYYHLDCFIIFVPDGKVIILNKNMLKITAYNDLKLTVGEENVIDLGHDYLGKPVLFNLVVIPLPEEKFLLFGPSLPDELIAKLEAYGYYVITPESLNQSHFRFNEDFAQKVTQFLQDAGWQVEVSSLVSSVPKYCAHYSLANIKQMVSLITSVDDVATVLDSVMQGKSPFQSITKNEGSLYIPLLSKFIPGLGGSKTIKLQGSDKEKIKYYLQQLHACNKTIEFDFAEFDASVNIPISIPFIYRGSPKKVSLVYNMGSVHCLLQECPTIVDGKINHHVPAQPLFIVKNDYALLKRYQAPTERVLSSINTVLRRAAAQGKIHDVKLAITSGAEVNSQDERRGYTALHWACKNGHEAVIQYLKTIDADPNIRCKTPAKQTPFDLLLEAYSAIKQPLDTTLVQNEGRPGF